MSFQEDVRDGPTGEQLAELCNVLYASSLLKEEGRVGPRAGHHRAAGCVCRRRRPAGRGACG